MARSSCTPKEPLIKLGQGEPPVLDYNLPQSTCLTATGRLPLAIATEAFQSHCFKAPEDNFWVRAETADATALAERLSADFKGAVAVPYVSVAGHRTAVPRRVDWTGPATGVAAPLPSDSPAPATRNSAPLRSSPIASTRRTTTARTPAPAAGTAPRVSAATSFEMIDFAEVATNISRGYRPFATRDFSGRVQLRYTPKPVVPIPRLLLVETYRMCSYLGDYGAGKTLNTFSLLPGEKTEITLRTYRDVESTSVASENILDSFSETSADEFESLVEDEQTVSEAETEQEQIDNSQNGGLSLGGDVLGITFGIGGQASHGKSTSASSTRTDNTRVLNRALERHVEETSYSREVEVNTSSTVTEKEGEESSVVRTIENINRSRVLNFVFRQLLQEYVTITWLDEVRLVYTNGYPESTVAIELHELDELLPDVIKPERVKEVKERILQEYCNVHNWRGQAKRFIERVERSNEGCEFGDARAKLVFYRKALDLHDEAEGITVPGVILSVQAHVLRTPAVVVESLLGQGEALDCYNAELQDAAVERAKLDNRKTGVALEILDAISDPEAKVRAYRRLFYENPDAAEDADSAEE
jgi:hypothetical protein